MKFEMRCSPLVRITTSGPDGVLPARMYWLKIVAPGTEANDDLSEASNGTGPYTYTGREAGVFVELAANPDVREAIEQHRPHPVPTGGGGVRKNLDLVPWHFAGVVAFLLVVAWIGLWLNGS